MACKALLMSELKERRQALGWSFQELGERCGIDGRFLSDWEHGIDSPRLEAVENWAGALGLRLGLTLQQQEATARGVRIDWGARRITVDGSPVRLTPMEWKALERLAAMPGELVTHQALFQHLYGAETPYRAQSTAIRVLITKLRRLLPLRIEARWGRGYVISGVEPSRPGAATESEPAIGRIVVQEPQRRSPAREHLVDRRDFAPREMPSRREPVNAKPHRDPAAAASARPPSGCRAEELSVIERFLAERGVTRCPDVKTIERSPLPTLVWDKMKRKWVRPSMSAREAG
jgi:transcriptional regulator with XRE-family HTH domain